MRLQKFLASAGVGSRRKCEEYIIKGQVRVNDSVITALGTTVCPTDKVYFNNQEVKTEETLVYYMLNKPTGYVTTVQDEKNRKTVLDLVKDVPYRIFPVGRLDYQTSGLLLLTNDGEFTYHMTHPKHHVGKTYVAKVKGKVRTAELLKLQNGIKIEDYVTSPAKVKCTEQTLHTSVLKMTIYEGKNRQVRKMCQAIGHEVITLKRTAIASLKLGDLPSGQYRALSPEEVETLREAVLCSTQK
jgi:23S rRNA pseudouridine2605 synthase